MSDCAIIFVDLPLKVIGVNNEYIREDYFFYFKSYDIIFLVSFHIFSPAVRQILINGN